MIGWTFKVLKLTNTKTPELENFGMHISLTLCPLSPAQTISCVNTLELLDPCTWKCSKLCYRKLHTISEGLSPQTSKRQSQEVNALSHATRWLGSRSWLMHAKPEDSRQQTKIKAHLQQACL